MEEEWDVINSVHSAKKSKRFRPSVELDFNRFETMPTFQLDEEDSISTLSYSNEKELMDEKELVGMEEDFNYEEGEYSCEEELNNSEPESMLNEETIKSNFDEESKVTENDIENKPTVEYENEIEGNSEVTENELEEEGQKRVIEEEEEEARFCESPLPSNNPIADLEVKEHQSFQMEETVTLVDDNSNTTSPIMLNNSNVQYFLSLINRGKRRLEQQNNSSQTTRESLVDKTTTWKNLNSISGSSVPFISTPPVSIPSSSTSSATNSQHNAFNQKPSYYPIIPTQLASSPTSSAPVSNNSSEVIAQDNHKEELPVILSIHHLHSFAAAPQHQLPSVWTTHRFTSCDISPVDETAKEQDVAQKLPDSFVFVSEENTINHLQALLPPLQEWYQLTTLNLSHQHLEGLYHLKDIFPLLENLNV